MVPLAAVLLHTGGAAPFHAHGVEDLRAPAGRSHMGAAAFWTLRMLLHVGVAAGAAFFSLRRGWFAAAPRTHLWLSILFGVGLHHGLHAVQGIPLAELLREQRAWDIPLFLVLGCFTALHWTGSRAKRLHRTP